MALTFQLCSKTEVIGGDTYENKKERPMRRQNPRPIPVDKADIRETVDAIVTNVASGLPVFVEHLEEGSW